MWSLKKTSLSNINSPLKVAELPQQLEMMKENSFEQGFKASLNVSGNLFFRSLYYWQFLGFKQTNMFSQKFQSSETARYWPIAKGYFLQLFQNPILS